VVIVTNEQSKIKGVEKAQSKRVRLRRAANPKKNPPRKSRVGIPSRASRAGDSPLSEGTSKSRSTEMNDSKAVAKKSHGKKRKKTLEVCKVMEF